MPQGATSEPQADTGGQSDATPPRSHAPARLFGRAHRVLLALVVILFASALLSGRVLGPALLGWRSGIEIWIDRSDLAAAWLGQLAVVAGCLLAIQLLIGTLVESNLSVAFRLVAAPVTAGVITLVMAASARELPVLLVLALATLSAVIALVASVPAVISDHSRAAGLVLAVAGLNALLSLTARALAVWAGHKALASLFHVAQGVATVCFALDVVALGITGFWLSARRWKAPATAAGIIVLGATVLAIAAVRGTGAAGGWTVLASKAVIALVRHPWPLVPPALNFAVELCVLLTALATLLGRRDFPYAKSAIALALIARAGTDIPVLALALLLAALMAALAAAREGPAGPPTPAEPRPERALTSEARSATEQEPQ